MMIRYLHGDTARVGVQYEETIAKLKKNFVIESVPNLGQAAVIVPVGPSFLV